MVKFGFYYPESIRKVVLALIHQFISAVVG